MINVKELDVDEFAAIHEMIAEGEKHSLLCELIWAYGMHRAAGMENNQAVMAAYREWDL